LLPEKLLPQQEFLGMLTNILKSVSTCFATTVSLSVCKIFQRQVQLAVHLSTEKLFVRIRHNGIRHLQSGIASILLWEQKITLEMEVPPQSEAEPGGQPGPHLPQAKRKYHFKIAEI